MLTQIDLNAFADYALSTFDYSADFEDDAFAVTFDDQRIYVERKRSHFVVHVGNDQHNLPRC
ncbi:hypothetical protein [Sphingomonas sp. M1A8_2b]